MFALDAHGSGLDGRTLRVTALALAPAVAVRALLRVLGYDGPGEAAGVAGAVA